MAQKKISPDIISLISKKIIFFEDVIQKTILHVQKNKMLDIIVYQLQIDYLLVVM